MLKDHPPSRPVFIGGCPRSGTTLLGSMLGAHKECLTVPESQFKIEALRSMHGAGGLVDFRASLNTALGQRRFWAWRVALNHEEVPALESFVSYGDLLEWVVTRYAEYVGKRDFKVWVDHTPSNKNHLLTLFEMFPKAKAIHIVRDGRAIMASAKSRYWGPNTALSAAHWWLEHVSLGLAAESALGSQRITRVKYEDLVTTPEKVLKPLCTWLDIEYDPAMAKGNGYKPTSEYLRRNPLIIREPDPTRAEAWKGELTSRQIEIFESRTMDLLRYLGYKLEFGLRARRINMFELAQSFLTEVSMVPFDLVRLKYRRYMASRETRF